MAGRKGRSGRRPKPTEVKELQGTLRPGREKKRNAGAEGLRFPVARLLPPAWLDDEGENEWNRIVPLLDGVRVLTEPDLVALANYCEAVSLLIRATKTYHREGIMKGKGAHPAVAVARDARNQCLRFAIEFGLTPAARTRVATGAVVPPTGPAEKPVDEAEQFLFHPPKLINGGKS